MGQQLDTPGLGYMASVWAASTLLGQEKCGFEERRIKLVTVYQYSTSEFDVPFSNADVASWREGGGRSLNSPNSPTDPEPKPLVQEDGNMPGPTEQSDVPKVPEKKETRIAPPPPPKMNGQQQPGILPQYRGMVPPYVSPVDQILAKISFTCKGHVVKKAEREAQIISVQQVAERPVC